MAKFVPTEGSITFGGTEYFAFNISMKETAPEVDTTDGNTSGDGREFLGGRVARSLTCEVFVIDTAATPVLNANGAFIFMVKDGTSTDKSWTYTDAVLLDKEIRASVSGDEACVMALEFRLNGAVTEIQFADI